MIFLSQRHVKLMICRNQGIWWVICNMAGTPRKWAISATSASIPASTSLIRGSKRKSEAQIEGAKGIVFSRRGIDAVVDPNRTYGQIVAQSEADPGTEIIERGVP